jgi:hypothetical protein
LEQLFCRDFRKTKSKGKITFQKKKLSLTVGWGHYDPETKQKLLLTETLNNGCTAASTNVRKLTGNGVGEQYVLYFTTIRNQRRSL